MAAAAATAHKHTDIPCTQSRDLVRSPLGEIMPGVVPRQVHTPGNAVRSVFHSNACSVLSSKEQLSF